MTDRIYRLAVWQQRLGASKAARNGMLHIGRYYRAAHTTDVTYENAINGNTKQDSA